MFFVRLNFIEFEKELPEVIEKETSGDFQSLLLKVLQVSLVDSKSAFYFINFLYTLLPSQVSHF